MVTTGGGRREGEKIGRPAVAGNASSKRPQSGLPCKPGSRTSTSGDEETADDSCDWGEPSPQTIPSAREKAITAKDIARDVMGWLPSKVQRRPGERAGDHDRSS